MRRRGATWNDDVDDFSAEEPATRYGGREEASWDEVDSEEESDERDDEEDW